MIFLKWFYICLFSRYYIYQAFHVCVDREHVNVEGSLFVSRISVHGFCGSSILSKLPVVQTIFLLTNELAYAYDNVMKQTTVATHNILSQWIYPWTLTPTTQDNLIHFSYKHFHFLFQNEYYDYDCASNFFNNRIIMIVSLRRCFVFSLNRVEEYHILWLNDMERFVQGYFLLCSFCKIMLGIVVIWFLITRFWLFYIPPW